MRVLAIDHGTVRMGIAISDELKMIAQPLEFIPAEPFSGFLDRFKALLQEYEVELVLLGMPRNMDGSYGEASIKVREFEAGFISAAHDEAAIEKTVAAAAKVMKSL